VKQKLICFDYDGTITDFPEFMESCRNRASILGYRVILCTMRYPEEEDEYIAELRSKFDAVYFTGRKAKQPFLKNLGIEPDLWFDDEPRWITTDAIQVENPSTTPLPQPDALALLKILLMRINPITASHRHGTPIPKNKLTTLCNVQIDIEQQIGMLPKDE